MTSLNISEKALDRATDLTISGMDAIEAMKQALLEEMNFLGSLCDGSRLSRRGQVAADYLAPRVYDKQRKQ